MVGVDARKSNLRHAQAAKELLRLDRVEFVHDDARNISMERLGRFDIIVCSRLLYHLNTPNVFHLVARMHEMVDHLLIIDTHISLTPDSWESHEGRVYHAHHCVEHGGDDAEEVKADRSLAS